jgi:hypothetical protein
MASVPTESGGVLQRLGRRKLRFCDAADCNRLAKAEASAITLLDQVKGKKIFSSCSS